jgi:hypothetical protein
MFKIHALTSVVVAMSAEYEKEEERPREGGVTVISID